MLCTSFCCSFESATSTLNLDTNYGTKTAMGFPVFFLLFTVTYFYHSGLFFTGTMVGPLFSLSRFRAFVKGDYLDEEGNVRSSGCVAGAGDWSPEFNFFFIGCYSELSNRMCNHRFFLMFQKSFMLVSCQLKTFCRFVVCQPMFNIYKICSFDKHTHT